MIVVATNSKRNEIPFKDKMFLKDAFKAAGITPKKDSTITINGKDPEGKNIELKDGDQIVITPKVSNG